MDFGIWWNLTKFMEFDSNPWLYSWLEHNYKGLIYGMLQPFPLKEITSWDYGHRGLHKRITTEGESLDNWRWGNPRSPMWPLSHNDGFIEPCRSESTVASWLGPADPKASLDAQDRTCQHWEAWHWQRWHQRVVSIIFSAKRCGTHCAHPPRMAAGPISMPQPLV
jgi:hypothetical protein